MRRVLLDEGVPIGVRRLLAGFSVQSVAEAGWAGLTNGDLIEAAEQAGFEVMVTADQNIRHHQNLTGRRLAVVVLTTNHWLTIRDHGSGLGETAEGVAPGSCVVFSLPRRPKRWRSPPEHPDC